MSTQYFTGGNQEVCRSRQFCIWGGVLALFVAGAVAKAADQPVAKPPVAMETVVVSGQKLAVETRIDRKVYNLATDLQATIGTVSDVLSAIPSVDVDPDGKVSLRGDSNVLVLIDGKPSTQLSGSAAGDNLQSIPAKDIERIEVITTPPAQFKADGAAGVINIITRKKHPDGVSGSLQGSLGSGNRWVVGANASYSTARWTASATAGFRQDYRQRLLSSNVLALDSATRQKSESTSSLNELIRRQAPTAGLSAQYALSDRQTVSASLSSTRRGGLRTYTQLNDTASPPPALSTSTERLSSGRDPEVSYDERMGYTKTLARAGEELDLSIHRSTSHQHEQYEYVNDSFIPQAARSYNNLSFVEDHVTTELTVDYALPLSNARTVKLGYALELDDFRFKNAGNNVDPVTGAQVSDANLTNDFKFRRQINATYASYQASNGAWGLLAGLRTELTRNDALQLTDRMSNNGSYFALYPSLHVDRRLSDQTTLSFGASRRVSRPEPGDLNPYVDHEYTPNLVAGNANLRPQFTQSYELGYGFEGQGLAYQLTGYYRRNRDSVTNLTNYLGNGFSLTTKTNLRKNDSAGLEITANGRIVASLAYSLSANLFSSEIDATALGLPGLQSTTGVNGKLKLDYRPTAQDSGQLIVTRTDKRLTPQGFVSAINIVNVGYKRQLRPDLTAILTVSDVFNGQHFERVESTPSFNGRFLRSVRGRVLYVGMAYSFGSTKKEKPANFEYDQAG